MHLHLSFMFSCCLSFFLWLFCFYFVLFFVYFYLVVLFSKKSKKKNSEKYKNNVCFVYNGTCVPWMAIETKFSKFSIFCSLDEYFYVQLSK